MPSIFSQLDRRMQDQKNDILSSKSGNTEQNVVITDIISEGPIAGLVEGGASVFVNNDQLMTADQTAYSSPEGVEVTLTTGSTSAPVSLKGNTFNVKAGVEGKKYLLVEDAYTINVTAGAVSQISATGRFSIPMGGKTTLTRTSGDTFQDEWNHPATTLSYNNSSWKITHGTVMGNLKLASGHTIKGVLSGISSDGQSTSTFTFRGTMGTTLLWSDNDQTTNAAHVLTLDLFLEIASISGPTITLANASPLGGSSPGTTYPFGITTSLVNTSTGDTSANTGEKNAKYDGAGFHFNPGTLDQEPLPTIEGTGVSAVALTIPGGNLEQGDSGKVITASGAQASLIDEVKILLIYPGGLYGQDEKKGKKLNAGAAYRIDLHVDRGGGGGDAYQTLVGGQKAGGVDVWGHGGQYLNSVSFEMRINLEQYQPFNGFKIRITRMTKSDYNDGDPAGVPQYPGFGYTGKTDHKIVGTSNIQSAIGIIKEKLNFPYTAYANVSFSTKAFQSVPTRTYECQGMKVLVPSNYITREENDGVASLYKRNVSTGAVESTNQFWDGNFRAEKVYTDNPAWVFYDILTNNRYGLGSYLKTSDIDKYALYKISKYCDELVPNGKGGDEPRFRANIYLTKATDCYKVLKDMATIFRGILYWTDSKFFPVIDEKKEPIYTFTQANVEDGRFDYQSTGEKTRVNRIIVSWNNPEADYKLEPLLVEDRENQIKTGTIKTEKAMAFGCTSEGQARRYGRWKLWTSINQTELVSFSTSMNAAFLIPGDIVNIQDESDFQIAFGGRVHSCTNSAITIDRDIASDFSGGYTYTIGVIIPKRAVLLQQDSATIATSGGNVNYIRGDQITQATVGGSVTTLLNASEDTTQKNVESAVDTSGNLLQLQYQNETVVEERTLTTGSTTTSEGRNTIPIGAAFSETPATGAIWAIKQIVSGSTLATEASYSEYKIVSIAEEDNGKFDITAVQYSPAKFDAVDSEFLLDTPDPVFPPEGTVEVPPPKALRVLRDPLYNRPGEEIIVSWDPPDAAGTSGVSTTYEHLAGYELTHTFGGDTGWDPVIRLNPGRTAFRFNNIPDGLHTIGIRSISRKDKQSERIYADIQIEDIFGGTHPRQWGLIKGAYSSANVEMVKLGSDKGTLKFTSDSYVVLPLTGEPEDAKRNTTADDDSWSLDCTPLAHTNWPQQNNETGANQGDWSFVFFDYSAVDAASPNANALKLVLFKDDTTTFQERIGYWYDGTRFVNNASSIWTSLGTCSVYRNSRKVVGSGFSSLKVPETIKIGASFAGKVAWVESNTVLWLDRPWNTSDATGQAISKQQLDIDYVNDFLVCGVSYHGGLNDSDGNSGLYGMGNSLGGNSLLIIQEDLESFGRSLLLSSNINVINYEPDDTDPTTIDQVTTFSSLTLDIDCVGYRHPQVQVTGNGFSQVSASPDTGFVNVTNNTRTLTIHNSSTLAYSATSLDFTVVVREREDASNTNKQLTKTFSIIKVKDGSIGTEGKTVDLTSTDWTITYTGRGTLLEYTSASGAENSSASNPITFTAAPRNFTEPLVRIKRKEADGTVNWLTGSSSTNYFLAQDNYTATYTPPTSGVKAHSEIIEVDVAEKKTSGWPATSDVKATDSNTLIYLLAGQGGFHISLGNPTHGISADNSGTVASGGYSGSGTTIAFYANGTQVAYDASSPYADNSWYVTGVASTNSSNWQYGGFSNATSYSVTLDDHSYTTMADTEVILITIAYKDVNGVSNTVQARQTLFKNKAGPSGVGADGKKTTQGYIYFRVSSGASNPFPNAGTGTYNVSQGGLTHLYNSSGSQISSGWQNAAHTVDVAGSYDYYAARYYGTETSSTSTISVTVTAAVTHTSFTGVVTFNSGTNLLQLNGNDLTTIDGASITTGILRSAGTSTSTNDGSAFASGSGGTGYSYFNLTNGAIATKNFRIDTSGNAVFNGSITGGTIGSGGSATGWRVVGSNLMGGGFINSSGQRTYDPGSAGYVTNGNQWPNANITIDGANSRIIVRETTSSSAGINRVTLGYLA